MDMYRTLSSGVSILLLCAGSAAFAASDAEIQKCITDKLAAAPKLSAQGFSVAVKNGAATLSGKAKNPGSKGAATGVAKRCNAVSVNNEISWDKANKSASASGETDAPTGAKSTAPSAKGTPASTTADKNADAITKDGAASKLKETLKDNLGNRAKNAANAGAPAAMP